MKTTKTLLALTLTLMLLLSIGTFHNQFCGGVSVNGIMHLVLHHLEEEPCGGSISIVVNCCGIDVCQFLIEATFRKTDLTDFC